MKKLITLELAITANAAISQTTNLSPQMVNTAGGSGLVAGTYYDYTVGKPITLFGGINTGCDSIFSGFQHCATDTLHINKATVAVGGATNFCQGQNVVLTAPNGANWLWSNSATTQTISVSASGTYYVRTTNSCGDTMGSNNVIITTINPPTPSICMVTTDSATNYNYNYIYWENNYTHLDSFIVYRYDPISASYLRIGETNKDSTHLMDTARHIGTGVHNGDPTYGQWKYKLAIKDSC